MAIYMAIFLGGTPIGAPLVGWIGDYFGARASVFVGGLTTGITALVVGGLLFKGAPLAPSTLHFLDSVRDRVRKRRRR